MTPRKTPGTQACERCGGEHLDPAREGFTYGCTPAPDPLDDTELVSDRWVPVVRVLDASHVDHGLSQAQLAWLLRAATDSGAYADGYEDAPHVVVQTFELPEELGTVPCGLHGPLMGDEPVPEAECRREVRGERRGESRLCDRPARQVRSASIITGPHEGGPLVLFTAFGGPVTPREPFELPETVECKSCRGRGWHGTLAIGGPSPETCYECKGAKVVANPERAESAACWAEHALSR